MNLEAMTVQDCLELYHMEGKCVVVNDGQIIRFVEENNEVVKRG